MKSKNHLSRRAFVKRLGAAITVPYIIPASALGKDGHVAPSNRISVGAIATGGQARGLINATLWQDDARVVALCDVNRNVLEGVKNKVNEHYGNQDCQTYHDFRDVIARKDIDAVIIAPPDHWHAIPCIQAANAGKDIYCEKPLTYTLEEGRAVVNAAKRNGIVFQVGSM